MIRFLPKSVAVPILPLLLILASPRAEASADARPSASAGKAPRADPRRLALGTMGTGGLLRFHPVPEWAGELRVQSASANSQEGDVRAMVFSLRAYRFFPERWRCRFYLGAEGGYAKTSLSQISGGPGTSPALKQSGFGDTSGFVGGGFAGLEYEVTRRIFLDLDGGPYVIGLKETVTGASQSNWDFVLNAALGVYLF